MLRRDRNAQCEYPSQRCPIKQMMEDDSPVTERPTYGDLEQRIRALEETVAEARQVQDALHESEEKFRALADSSPSAVMLYQGDRWVFASKAAETITGYSQEELLQMNYWDIAHPDYKELAKEQGRRRERGEGTVTRYELRIVTKDGVEKWMGVAGAPAMIGGQPGGVISAADITERKRAEQDLIRERNLLQTIMNGAGKAHLVYLDRDFNFVLVNETYAATCGYRPEEMIGKNHFALYPHPENEAIFARVRDTGEAIEVRDKPFEFPDQAERGVTYWDWTLRPVKDDTGNVTGLVFSLHETTERKKDEEKLEQTVLELSKALTKVKTLSGLLPICASCKRIRNDKGYWEQLEEYITKHSEALFSHGICPECKERLYPKVARKK